MALLWAFVSCLYGASLWEVKVLEVSSSKRSVVLDVGRLNHWAPGDLGQIYLRKFTGEVLPEYSFVAAGEAVKVGSGRSFWFFDQLEQKEHLRPGAKLVLAKLESRGRGPWRIRQTLVLGGERKITPQRAGRYLASEGNLSETTVPKKQHLEIRRTIAWTKESEAFSERYGRDILRLIPEGGGEPLDVSQVKEWIEREVGGRSVRGALEKSMEPGEGFERLGEGQSYYQWLSRRRKKEEAENIRVAKRLKQKEPDWSATMGDRQLRNFFISSGLVDEINRQQKLLGRRSESRLILRYNIGLSSHFNKNNPAYRNRDHAFSVGYELPLERLSLDLERFCLEGELSQNSMHLDVGVGNGLSREILAGGRLNWYVNALPTVMVNTLFYGGVGFFRGRSDVTTSAGTFSYEVMHFPSFRGGVKHRVRKGDPRKEMFKVGLGVDAALSWDFARYSGVDFSSRILREGVKESMNYQMLKLSVGLNIYF